MLRFSDPHLYEERRQLRLEDLQNDNEWLQLDAQLCGDTTVWRRLEEYARSQGPAE
jgi:hypothetical protein